ncbi:zinc finger, CCHC-type containing protein [Tanacetum coccineum]
MLTVLSMFSQVFRWIVLEVLFDVACIAPFGGVTASGNTHEENVGQSSTGPTAITQAGNGADVVIPVESIRAVCEMYANSVYGFFLEKGWPTPFYMDGLDSMLENGPWFIRNNPLILKKWNLNVNLMKEDVVNVSVWVKLHGVPVTAFTEDGLSANVTNIGSPLMLDPYKSDMCIQSWGRSSYARALIEIRVDMELKDTNVVFGHIEEECPKNLGLGRAKNLKKPSQAPKGVPVGSKMGFKPTKEYRPVAKKTTTSTIGNKKKSVDLTKG